MKKVKKEKVEKVQGLLLESILDLNSSNVWNITEQEIRILWEAEKAEGNFTLSEEKLLNVIRLGFEVVHYNRKSEQEVARYENGEWEIFDHCNPGRSTIAIRKKHITSLADLSYENIHHITAVTLLELIDRNFGGGWDSIPLAMKDIIESAFDISTTTLPERRMYAEGGTRARKIAQGYEVLDVQKGTWVEAIFAKKKDPMHKLRFNEDLYDEDGNLLKTPLKNRSIDDDDLDEDLPEEDDFNDNENDEDEELNTDDETFYSNFSEEAVVKDVEEDGLPIEGDYGGGYESDPD